MHKHVDDPGFQPINQGYNTVFRLNRLSLGVVVPLETYSTGVLVHRIFRFTVRTITF